MINRLAAASPEPEHRPGTERPVPKHESVASGLSLALFFSRAGLVWLPHAERAYLHILAWDRQNVIALSQLSRALEQRSGDHRPLLSDLRESGAIEQDADVVMFIYRASVYGLNPEYVISDENVVPENVAELILRKQRNGPIGSILLHWTKEYTRFAEFDYISTDDFF